MSTPIAARSARQPIDLVVGLAHADDQARLGHEPGGLRPGQHRQAAGVAGRRTHGPLEPGDGLDVVVEDIGTHREQHVERAGVALDVGDQGLDARRRAAQPDRVDAGGDVGHPAVGEVVAGDHREHGVVEAHPLDGLGHRAGSSASGAIGLRVSTRQNPHARVQRSPSTMNVAVPSAQHSDRFGQPASSQTVMRSSSRSVRRSANTSGPCFTIGRSHSGLRLSIDKPPATPASARRDTRRTGSPGP